MKKKRKKNTSIYSPLTCHSPSFLQATAALERKSGSAPDVPTKPDHDSELHSCYQFAQQLFGKEDWQADPHFSNVCLRTFSKQLTEKTFVKWNTVQIDDRLFIHVPLGLSRDSFVALLDYAEEELEVTKAFVCLDRNNQSFNDLIKAFRFMGFEHLMPNQPFALFEDDSNANLTASFPKSFHILGYDFD